MSFECKGCLRIYNNEKRLKIHMSNCQTFLKQIQILKEEVKSLQDFNEQLFQMMVEEKNKVNTNIKIVTTQPVTGENSEILGKCLERIVEDPQKYKSYMKNGSVVITDKDINDIVLEKF